MSTASEVSRQPTQLQGPGYTEAFDRAMSTSSSFDTGVSGSRRNNGRGNGRELSTGDSASGSYSQTQSHDASLSQGLRHGGESSTTSSRNGNTSPEDAFWDAQQPSSGRNSNLGAYDFGNDGSGMLRPGQPAVFSHSNASAPHFDEPGSASRGPPLADDLGLDKLSIDPSAKRRGQVLTGSSNSSTQAIPQSRERIASSSYDAELQRSADEVRPANGLRAIADELDRTADDFVGPGTRRGSERSSGGTSSATHGRSTSRSQTLPNPDVYAQGGYGPQPGSSAYPQYVPQNAFLPGAPYRERRPSEQYAQQQGVYEPGQYPGQGGGWYGPDGTYYDEAQMQAQQQQYGVDPFAQAPPHHQQANGYFTSPQMAGAGYEGAAGPSMGGPMWAPGYSMQYPGGPAPPPGYGMYAPPPGMDPSGQLSAPYALHRQSTGLSSVSAVSANSAAARRRSKDAAAKQTQQSLPFNKAFVDEYRQRMKGDPDAEAQFAYARYLIEAAKKVSDPKDGPKQARKYRDSLLGESLKLIKRLATTGMGLGKPPFAEAQFFLANCFGNGSLGLQVDHEKAYNLYVQASKQNHAAATYRTAVCNEVGAGTRRDHHRAVLFYRKASALGDTAGMYKLGMILLNGLLGQPRNIREAIVWLKRAAGQADEDNPHALHELGLLHEKPNNNVVPVDEAYARELFTQAAQLGYAPSQFKLGSAYEYGSLTCPVDPRRSIAWYTKAAGKNDGESELALSGWYLTGSEGVLKQSDSEAYLWARRAATKGIPKAEYAVGYYSEVGIGVDADVEEAKRWYMRAAAQGNKRAMMRLTELKQQRSTGRQGKKARPTRKDAERECIVM